MFKLETYNPTVDVPFDTREFDNLDELVKYLESELAQDYEAQSSYVYKAFKMGGWTQIDVEARPSIYI